MKRKWITVAPNQHEITLSLGYLNQAFKHGSFVYDEWLAKEYPEYFKEVPNEPKKKKEEVVEQPVEEKVEKNETSLVDELMKQIKSLQEQLKSKEPAKKGRPASKFPNAKKEKK